MLIHSLQRLHYSEQIQETQNKLKRGGFCQLPTASTSVSSDWSRASQSREDKPVILGEDICGAFINKCATPGTKQPKRFDGCALLFNLLILFLLPCALCAGRCHARRELFANMLTNEEAGGTAPAASEVIYKKSVICIHDVFKK